MKEEEAGYLISAGVSRGEESQLLSSGKRKLWPGLSVYTVNIHTYIPSREGLAIPMSLRHLSFSYDGANVHNTHSFRTLSIPLLSQDSS